MDTSKEILYHHQELIKQSTQPDPEEAVRMLHEELQFLWKPADACAVIPAGGSMLTPPR